MLGTGLVPQSSADVWALLEAEICGFGCLMKYLDLSLQTLICTVSTMSRWRTREGQFCTNRRCMNVRPHCLRSSSRRVHRAPAAQRWTVRWEENTPESLEQNKFLSLVTLGKPPVLHLQMDLDLAIAEGLCPGLELQRGPSEVQDCRWDKPPTGVLQVQRVAGEATAWWMPTKHSKRWCPPSFEQRC